MEAQQMINQVRRLYEEGYTNVNATVCKELCDSKLKIHDAAFPQGKKGVEAFIETERNYKDAFPNKKAKIDDIFAAGDRVIVLWTCTGTHEGELHDIPPTHRKFSINGISIYQFSNGKISEIWQSWDRLSLLEQLGVVEKEHALHG